MQWSCNMIHSHFTLCLRICDYLKRLSQHPWYGLWMRVKGLHHYKVTALGSCVKWPLHSHTSLSLERNVKQTWTSSAFSTNESAWSVMVTGSQSCVWGGLSPHPQTLAQMVQNLQLVEHNNNNILHHISLCFKWKDINGSSMANAIANFTSASLLVLHCADSHQVTSTRLVPSLWSYFWCQISQKK